MGKQIDCTGVKFGRATATKPNGKTKSGKTLWLCKCDCGNLFTADYYSLKSGHTKSCGCLQRYVASQTIRKHGQSSMRLYRIWAAMKSRCNNPHNIDFHNYGGRGIKVCQEWSESFETFRDWADANGYSEELTIDRIDNNKNYCPENCRWADMLTQHRNQRRNVLLTFQGVTKTRAEWSEICGLGSQAIRHRLERGWSVEKALTTPQLRGRKKSKKIAEKKMALLKQQAI